MSLVYAENSDQIGCALHVFICATEVYDTYNLMYWNIRFMWLRMYESLRTYVANIDLVGDPLQGIYCVRASELLITKCVGYPI